MEKARYNTELYSNIRAPLNNVKPPNFWESHHLLVAFFIFILPSETTGFANFDYLCTIMSL